MASEDAVDFINRVDKGGPSIGQLIQNEAQQVSYVIASNLGLS